MLSQFYVGKKVYQNLMYKFGVKHERELMILVHLHFFKMEPVV